VIPQLIVWAGGIIPHVDSVDEIRLSIRRVRVRAPESGISQIGELTQVALAAEGTLNTHEMVRY
jgi:hypothetical protein